MIRQLQSVLLTLGLMMVMGSASNAQFSGTIQEGFETTTCSNPSNAFYELCINQWSSVCGSPDIRDSSPQQGDDLFAAEGNQFVHMYAEYLGNFCFNSQPIEARFKSEGIALRYNFFPNRTYRVRFAYQWRGKPGTIASSNRPDLEVQALLTGGAAGNHKPNKTGGKTNCQQVDGEVAPPVIPQDLGVWGDLVDFGDSSTEWHYADFTIENIQNTYYTQLWFRPEAVFNGNNPGDVVADSRYAFFLDDFSIIDCSNVEVDPTIIDYPIVNSNSAGQITSVTATCVSNSIPVRHLWKIHNADTDAEIVGNQVFSGLTASAVTETFTQGMVVNQAYYIKHGIYTTINDGGCRIRWREHRYPFEVIVNPFKSIDGPKYIVNQLDLDFDLSDEYFEEMDKRARSGEFEQIKTEQAESLNQIIITNYPNPFSDNTKIEYIVESEGPVSINVLNNNGQVIQTLLNNVQTSPGTHQVVFDRNNLSSGIYFYRITAGEYSETQKMILID